MNDQKYEYKDGKMLNQEGDPVSYYHEKNSFQDVLRGVQTFRSEPAPATTAKNTTEPAPSSVPSKSEDVPPTGNGAVRTYGTGATRSSAEGRIDPEGFISPIVLDRFSEYMHKHRHQADGSLRDSDNWQKGMPLVDFAKGMWRHFLHFWLRHRGWEVHDPKAGVNIEEDLCAIIFNAQGYLHEIIKKRYRPAGVLLTASYSTTYPGIDTGDPESFGL